MAITRYRRIPQEVDVVQWTGDNIIELVDFLSNTIHIISPCHLIHAEAPFYIDVYTKSSGKVSSRLNDYLVKDKDNEVEIFTPNLFKKLYKEI